MIEGLLWKQGRGILGTKWTRRWVVADERQLAYFNTSRRPGRGAAPRKVISLQHAVIKEIKEKDKPYSFAIEAGGAYVVVLACDDVMEYDAWLQRLQNDRDTVSDRSDDARHHRSAEQLNTQARMLNDVSIIQDFFDNHSQGGKAWIAIGLIPTLLAEVNIRLSEDALHALRVELDPENSGGVAKAAFQLWWINFTQANPLLDRDRAATGTSNGLGAASPNAEALDGREHSSEEAPHRQALLTLEIPDIDTIPPQAPPPLHDFNDAFQRSAEDEMHLRSASDIFHHAVFATNIIGRFTEAAAEGAMTLIEEYTLPAELQSVPKIVEHESSPENTQGGYYLFQPNIILRIIQPPTAEEDVSPSELRRKQLCAEDDLLAKLAAHDLRNGNAIRQAVSGISRKLVEQSEASPENYRHFHTPVSCIVDYKGFRVVATAIFPIDGSNTLLPPFHDVGESPTHQLEGLANIAARLNLKEQLVAVHMGSSKIVSLGDAQVHKGYDERCYIVDTQAVMPADLPRPGTNDAITKQLRPELVRAFATPLFSQAYQMNTGVAVDSESLEKAAADASTWQLLHQIETVAQKLDGIDVIMYKPRTFCEFVHKHGVNCRHLGHLHKLCKLKHAKSLVFSDIVARTAKYIVGHSCRAILREGRAQSMVAETRGRSKASNFEEHAKGTHERVADIYVEALNSLLGAASSHHQAFWEDHIIPAAQRLFGYDADFTSRTFSLESCERVMLFYFLQHHLGIECGTINFNWRSVHPFQRKDIAKIHARVKWYQNKNSPSGKIISNIDELIRQELYAKAIKALDFQLCLNKYLGPLSMRPDCEAEALIQMAECAIAQREHSLAVNLINRGLQTGTTNPATIGRLHAIMMICEGAVGRMAEAVDSFDRSIHAYTQIVPVAHPLVLELCVQLGDLYFNCSAFDHAYIFHHMCTVLTQRELGQFHPCNAMLFCKLAVLLFKRGSHKQALPFAKASFALYEEMMLAGLSIELEMAESCLVYADAVAAVGDVATAVQVAEEAVNILTSKGGDNQELIKQAKLRLALLYEQAGSVELATSMCDEVLELVKDAVKDGDAAEIPVMQSLTKMILRLYLGVQPLQVRAFIEQLRSESVQDEIITEVVPYVVEQLFHRNPGEFVQSLFESIPAIAANKSDPANSSTPQILQSEPNRIASQFSRGMQLAAISILADA